MKKTSVILLFAACGACSSLLFDERLRRMVEDEILLRISAGVPFAVLALFLLWPGRRGLWITPLVVATWVAAYMTALTSFSNIPGVAIAAYPAACAGGLAGGAGLAVCTNIVLSRWELRRTLLLCAVSTISALAFGPWLSLHIANLGALSDSILLAAAFAIWQAAVGGYLYATIRERAVVAGFSLRTTSR